VNVQKKARTRSVHSGDAATTAAHGRFGNLFKDLTAEARSE
jgi:hypothetical protein